MGVLLLMRTQIASIADMNIGEGNQEAPVGTTIALIERSMKVMLLYTPGSTTVYAVSLSCSRLLFGTLCQSTRMRLGRILIARSDFDDRVDIIPVSDPQRYFIRATDYAATSCAANVSASTATL